MLKYQIVDAFTDKPIAGNPVAIFFPRLPLDNYNAKTRKEMNLSRRRSSLHFEATVRLSLESLRPSMSYRSQDILC